MNEKKFLELTDLICYRFFSFECKKVEFTSENSFLVWITPSHFTHRNFNVNKNKEFLKSLVEMYFPQMVTLKENLELQDKIREEGKDNYLHPLSISQPKEKRLEGVKEIFLNIDNSFENLICFNVNLSSKIDNLFLNIETVKIASSTPYDPDYYMNDLSSEQYQSLTALISSPIYHIFGVIYRMFHTNSDASQGSLLSLFTSEDPLALNEWIFKKEMEKNLLLSFLKIEKRSLTINRDEKYIESFIKLPFFSSDAIFQAEDKGFTTAKTDKDIFEKINDNLYIRFIYKKDFNSYAEIKIIISKEMNPLVFLHSLEKSLEKELSFLLLDLKGLSVSYDEIINNF